MADVCKRSKLNLNNPPSPSSSLGATLVVGDTISLNWASIPEAMPTPKMGCPL